MKNEKILSIVVVISMIFIGIIPINAEEKEMTIYNSTLGEILEVFAPEEYNQLPPSQKVMYETTEAYTVLAEDATMISLPVVQNSRAVIWKPYAIVFTNAVYTRTNTDQVNYGGTYSCTMPVKIFGSAYLIRSGDGKIIDVTTASNRQTIGISSKKNLKLTKTSSKYYVRAFGDYTDTENGARVSTSQETISRY